MITAIQNTTSLQSIFNPYRILYESLNGHKGESMSVKGAVYPSGRNFKFYVVQNGSKEWYYTDPVYHDPFDTEIKARVWLERAREEVAEGVFNPKAWRKGSPLDLSIYAKDWLNSVDVAVVTYRGYKASVEQYIVPFFKGQDIRYVRYNDLVKFKKYLETKLTSKGVYNKIYTLKKIFNDAYRNQDIFRVPPFPKMSYDKPEIEYLTLDQQQQIIEAIPQRHRPIFQFMMEYGVRPGEARGLQKDCIKDGQIIIKRAFSDEILRETTKTGEKGVRTFLITPYFQEILNSLPLAISPFVFTREDGQAYKRSDLPRIWNEACKATGIKIKLYNGVRHSLGCQ